MATLTNFSALLQLGGGGGGGTLATVLASGNATGGSDILFSASTGDGIDTENNAAGPGFALDIDGSDAGGGNFNGGDINLNPGLGSGTGVPGVVNINGDLVVSGSVSLSNLVTGAGSPEGGTAAPVSTIFQRTDGGAGNSVYFKMSGAGATGWVPAGPPVFETFVAVGVATFVTSRAVFDDPLALGVENIAVFWNGVLQREGGADDYTVVFGGASATITFTSTPPPGDFITIRYLPA